jgi:2-polyprenyl-6-methoxyphenol hydroxylase-like FAD-dependent oxidoreductase
MYHEPVHERESEPELEPVLEAEPDVTETQVVLVGGGPVGAGLAIELGQRGVRCILVERYLQPQPIPKGQNLTQRTLEHFHFWKAEPELRAARTIPKAYGIGGMTAYRTLLSGYSHDWLQRELVHQFYFTDNERLPQYATEAVLRQRASEIPTIETLYGWTAETITQDARGVMVVASERVRDGEGEGNGSNGGPRSTVAGGADGAGESAGSDGANESSRASLANGAARRRVLRAAYVVGCDGSRSRVREQAGLTQTRSDHDRLMVLLVFRSEGLHQVLSRFPGKSFYYILHPDLKGYWQFFGRVDLGTTWFFHSPVPAGTTRDNFDFPAYLRHIVGADFDIAIEHLGLWDLRFAVADAYRAARIFIAGDAAHSHPPYGGYGINTGLEDAVNLGWKLAATLDGWGGARLLDTYSEERQPVFASTARDFIEKAIHTDRDSLESFSPERDLGAFEEHWRTRQDGARAEVSSFEPHYEGSSIVFGPPCGVCSAVGGHAFAARAGHHLAPAPLSSGRNVYDALGDGFTLLAFDDGRPAGDDQPASGGLDNSGGEGRREAHGGGASKNDARSEADGLEVSDTGDLTGAAIRAFGKAAELLRIPLTVVRDTRADGRERYEATLVLVRPDQFVAWAGGLPHDALGILARAAGRDPED